MMFELVGLGDHVSFRVDGALAELRITIGGGGGKTTRSGGGGGSGVAKGAVWMVWSVAADVV
jgi:hypothetical protein